MTKEEAIMVLKNEQPHCGKKALFPEEKKYEAYDMAIKALEQESCDDCVRRQEVLDILKDKWNKFSDANDAMQESIDTIEALKPVTPQPKAGHWFVDERPESDREVICSNCEQPIFKYHKLGFDYRPKYCPNCGAKMESEEELNDKRRGNRCDNGVHGQSVIQ